MKFIKKQVIEFYINKKVITTQFLFFHNTHLR